MSDEFSRSSDLGDVAIVHDYLNQRGGAERVVLELADWLPEAPIYTSIYRPASTFPEFAERDIRTSPLDRLPIDRHFRGLFPLYPAAFRAMGPIDADIVISSSSGWAHAVRTTERAVHVVYCHTPARWLWTRDYGLGSPLAEALLRPGVVSMRAWDRRVAREPDLYIANSHEIRDRIRMAYNRDAVVAYPPVSVERFTPTSRGERLLVVSRLLPHKRIDLAVDAATQLGIGLDVVGSGPMLEALRARAGPSVSFHGQIDDAALLELFQHCRAFCLPAREDFGIAPVEAQAAGKPVIAFAGGGALETVDDGVSGVFFEHTTVDSFVDGIRRCDAVEDAPTSIRARANRFSREAFRRRMNEVLGRSLARRPWNERPT